MGVDSKLFVTAKPEQANVVYGAVRKALNKWQRNLLDIYWDRKGFDTRLQFLFRDKSWGCNQGLKDWTNGVGQITTLDFESFQMHFTVNGEYRSLFCTHSCSSNYKDTYEGDKIIFLLGYWGMSDEIMKVVGEACKPFGEVYYDFNDCDSEGFVKLN